MGGQSSSDSAMMLLTMGLMAAVMVLAIQQCQQNQNQQNQSAFNQCMFDPTGMCPRQMMTIMGGQNLQGPTLVQAAQINPYGAYGMTGPYSQGYLPANVSPLTNLAVIHQAVPPGQDAQIRAEAARISDQLNNLDKTIKTSGFNSAQAKQINAAIADTVARATSSVPPAIPPRLAAKMADLNRGNTPPKDSGAVTRAQSSNSRDDITR